MPDSVWIDDDTLYTITAQANPTTTLKKWVVRWDTTKALSAWDTLVADTVSYNYTGSGLKHITYFVVDGNGTRSDTVNKTVLVRLGAPTIRSITLDSASSKIFINDSLHFTVQGFDTNGVIDSMKVSWMGDTNFSTVNKTIQSNTSVFANAFATSGAKQIRFRVYDNDGLSADTVIPIFVRQGKPVISSVTTDVPLAGIFRDKPVNFTVNGQDTNGNIVSLKVAWNGDTAFSPAISATANSGVFNNTFTAAGTKTVRFRVYDNDGLSADTTISFPVHQGKPVVTSITPDSIIFINDSRKFTIATFDSNGTVDSIKIDNGSGTFGLFVKTTGNLDTLKRAFGRLEAGTRIVRAIAKDNDGLLSDTARDTVTVRLGTPVIDSMQVPATIWINDTNTYQIAAHDTNGTIVKYYFDWTNSGTWQDSGTSASKLGGHFKTAGADSIRFGVMDNDTLLTISKKKIMVHLGVPHVWNQSGDTMFVVTPNVGNYNLHISASDTNGTFSQFYWSAASPWDTTNATKSDSNLSQYISTNDINLGYKMAVFGKDDDGNVSGDTFWLYPDAPPPAPTINAVVGTDSITIYWLGKDAKDLNQTQYRVLLHDGSEPDSSVPADILSNWKAGYRVSDDSGYDYMYRFKLTANTPKHLKYYQVHARDARGSISPSTTGHTFSY